MSKLFDKIGLVHDRHFINSFMKRYRALDMRLIYFENSWACLKVTAPLYSDAVTILDFFDGAHIAYNDVANEIAKVIEGFFKQKLGVELRTAITRLQPGHILIVTNEGRINVT